MIGDNLSIRDAFVINIGVDFEIITLPSYNNNRVIRNCLTALINFFNVDKWQINQPIILRNINVLLENHWGLHLRLYHYLIYQEQNQNLNLKEN